MRIHNSITRHLAVLALCVALSPVVVKAAPVVPIPGESGSYLVFPSSIDAAVSVQKTETVGRISMFPMATLPAGWLECNGATVSAAAYPDLVKYLAGASATSATLPDLRGVFVRGLDNGRGIDSGRVLGSYQDSENLSHTHTGSTSTNGNHAHAGSTSSVDGAHSHSTYYAFVGHGAGSGSLASPLRTSGSWASWPGTGTTMSTQPDHTHTLSIGAVGDHAHTVTIGASGIADARPRNVSVIFAIRAE